MDPQLRRLSDRDRRDFPNHDDAPDRNRLRSGASSYAD